MPAQPQVISDTTPDRDIYIAVLTEFATYGFRKTSMAVLAGATGVARQTLYNRFESKEAILSWAVDGLIDILRRHALDALQDRQAPIEDVLFESLRRWLEPVVQLLHSGRHAGEIFTLSTEMRGALSIDPLQGVAKPIEQYLLQQKACTDKRQAADAVYLLLMAAKGLMVNSQSEADFRKGLARVIRGSGLIAAREGGARA